jgi:hypothetical protein
MANVDNPNGFNWVYNQSGNPSPKVDTVTLAGTVAAGDTLVASSGTATIGLSNSGALLGVAAEAGVSGDVIKYYPATDDAVFVAQCSGTFAATMLFGAYDIEGTTGIQEVNEDSNTEKVVQIVGYDPSSEVGANTRVYVTFPRSQYTGLEDAE